LTWNVGAKISSPVLGVRVWRQETQNRMRGVTRPRTDFHLRVSNTSKDRTEMDCVGDAIREKTPLWGELRSTRVARSFWRRVLINTQGTRAARNGGGVEPRSVVEEKRLVKAVPGEKKLEGGGLKSPQGGRQFTEHGDAGPQRDCRPHQGQLPAPETWTRGERGLGPRRFRRLNRTSETPIHRNESSSILWEGGLLGEPVSSGKRKAIASLYFGQKDARAAVECLVSHFLRGGGCTEGMKTFLSAIWGVSVRSLVAPAMGSFGLHSEPRSVLLS